MMKNVFTLECSGLSENERDRCNEVELEWGRGVENEGLGQRRRATRLQGKLHCTDAVKRCKGPKQNGNLVSTSN
jgi:hypothetical protein